jgi:hypothetical protein
MTVFTHVLQSFTPGIHRPVGVPTWVYVLSAALSTPVWVSVEVGTCPVWSTTSVFTPGASDCGTPFAVPIPTDTPSLVVIHS